MFHSIKQVWKLSVDNITSLFVHHLLSIHSLSIQCVFNCLFSVHVLYHLFSIHSLYILHLPEMKWELSLDCCCIGTRLGQITLLTLPIVLFPYSHKSAYYSFISAHYSQGFTRVSQTFRCTVCLID